MKKDKERIQEMITPKEIVDHVIALMEWAKARKLSPLVAFHVFASAASAIHTHCGFYDMTAKEMKVEQG